MNKSLKILTIVIWLAAAGAVQVQAKEESGFSKMVGSINSSIKSGFSKVSDSLSPKKEKAEPSDATSLQVKAKPSAKLYVSAANMHAANGDLKEAENMYKRALDISSDNPDALIGYAMLKDKMGSYKDAVATYEEAVKANPENAAVYNGLGLCHATHGNLDGALAALEKAVNLEPRQSKYRNNIAMVLVEAGRYDAAFAHFKTQYNDSVAHYNLAYLIQKRGDKPNAVKHFAAAMRIDPNLSEARVWYNHLTSPPTRQAPGRQMRVHHQPVQQRQQLVTNPPVNGPVLAAQQPAYGAESAQPPINRPRVWVSMQETAAQREAAAQAQLGALGPASRPVQAMTPQPVNNDPQSLAFRSRPDKAAPGSSADVARQTSIQRLPPIEQSFQSNSATPSRQQAPPVPPPSQVSIRGTSDADTAPFPQKSEGFQLRAPIPPTPQTPVRTGTRFNRPVYEHPPQPGTVSLTDQVEAPMPGSIVPTSPPSSGTTRAPLVYPLPPVDGYQR